MRDKEKVIIQIVTYNSVSCIEKCLESVEKQTFKDFLVLLLDNQSSDDTVHVIEKFKSKSDIRMELICSTTNSGFCKGHNDLFAKYSSTYRLVLNPDAELAPDYIEEMQKFMSDNRSIGMAAGTIFRDKDKLTIDSLGIKILKSRRAIDIMQGKSMPDCIEEISVDGCTGAVAFYREEMLNQCNIDGEIFDVNFFAYKEDVDLAWRSRLFGWEAAYVPNAIAYHERGWKPNGRGRISRTIRIHSYKNRYLMLLKNETASGFLQAIPWIAAYEVALLGYCLLREPFLLRSYLTVFTLLKVTLKKRQLIRKKLLSVMR